MIQTILGLPPLDKEQEQLVHELFKAHRSATLDNENLSKAIFSNAAFGSGDAVMGIAAGLLSTGGVHAPIVKARSILFHQPIEHIVKLLDLKIKIPGFGNSFHKQGIDPAFRFVQAMCENGTYPEYDRVLEIQEIIKKGTGKLLYPNAAAFTAIVAERLKLAKTQELALFIIPRIGAWLSLPQNA